MWRQATNFPATRNSATASSCLIVANFKNPTLRMPKRHENIAKIKRRNTASALKMSPEKMDKERSYWLLKTEPGEWSWENQAANGGLSKWDGVKNKQAKRNMKSMRIGDLCFFYHSGSKARRVVGVVSVVREWYEDAGSDGAVDVKEVGEMRRPVDLGEMKKEIGVKDFGLFRQPRLSVVPVEKSVWERVCEMGCGFEGDGAAAAADGDDRVA